jgi:hypothetical protein
VDTPVTLHKILHNNGPEPLVSVIVTTLATEPPGCTATPGAQTPPNPVDLPESVDVPVDEEWTIHCDAPSTHVFTFDNSIALVPGPAVDPDDTNNSWSTDLTVDAIAQADVAISDQSFVSPPTEIIASDDTVVTLRKTLHNNGAYGPVDVDITMDVTLPGAPPTCTATPDPGNAPSATLQVSVDVIVDEDWTIHCDGEATGLVFTFDNSIAITTPHVTDPGPGPNTASTDLTVDVISRLGDVNCDDTLTAVDALFVLQYIVGLRAGSNQCPPPVDTLLYLPAANVNGDGKVSAVDALFILQCVVGIPNVLCPAP